MRTIGLGLLWVTVMGTVLGGLLLTAILWLGDQLFSGTATPALSSCLQWYFMNLGWIYFLVGISTFLFCVYLVTDWHFRFRELVLLYVGIAVVVDAFNLAMFKIFQHFGLVSSEGISRIFLDDWYVVAAALLYMALTVGIATFASVAAGIAVVRQVREEVAPPKTPEINKVAVEPPA
jgi:hypothetical protein